MYKYILVIKPLKDSIIKETNFDLKEKQWFINSIFFNSEYWKVFHDSKMKKNYTWSFNIKDKTLKQYYINFNCDDNVANLLNLNKLLTSYQSHNSNWKIFVLWKKDWWNNIKFIIKKVMINKIDINSLTNYNQFVSLSPIWLTNFNWDKKLLWTKLLDLDINIEKELLISKIKEIIENNISKKINWNDIEIIIRKKTTLKNWFWENTFFPWYFINFLFFNNNEDILKIKELLFLWLWSKKSYWMWYFDQI